MIKAIILVTSLFSLSSSLLAYPNFISKGYHACLTCHYNPFGNGPLNDYGRGVAGSTLADRLLISDKTTDEQLGESSGFLFSQPENKWFRPAVDYRSLYLIGDINDSKSEPMFIHMQMDASATMIFGEKKNLIVSGTYGVIPSNSSRTKEEEWYSREHYIGYRPVESLGLYIGKMDKVFGIRVPDHTAYSRGYNNLGQYDATHGAVVHIGQKNFDLGIQYFIGNKEVPDDEQSQGYTTKLEYSISEKVRLGFSYLSEEYDTYTQTLNSLLAKMGIGKGSSVMLEYGQKDKTLNTGSTVASQYLFMQNHILLKRGLFFMMTMEQYKADITSADEVYKITPGIQYFPFQRLEVRAELTNNKQYEAGTIKDDTWSFFGQMHLWF
jgi:hypothetical protein